MKKNKTGISWICVIFLLITELGSVSFADSDVRKRSDFDFGWKFIKGEVADAQQINVDESSWSSVQLPHDWAIEGPIKKNNRGGERNGFFPGGVGWYRKHFQLRPEDKGKNVFVQFAN